MHGLRTVLSLLFVMLAGSASLSSASAPAPTDPENLRGLSSRLEAPLKEWLVAWRAVQPGLRLEQFTKRDTRAIEGPWRSRTIDLSQDLSQDLGFPLYVFSPDRRRFVDPFGGLVLSKRNGYVEAGFQPDSWVILIDLEASRLRDVLVCGTACGFHEAVWLSNDSFVVAGYGEVQPKEGCPGGYTHAPWLYLISLPRNSATWYAGPASCEGVGSEYVIQKVRQKIPNARF